jgi:signal transduction histidine kinase
MQSSSDPLFAGFLCRVLLAAVLLCMNIHVRADPVPTNGPPRTYATLHSKWGVGSWIWADRVYDKQICHLWRGFDVPDKSPVARAELRIAVDNGFRLLLDGREIGRGSDWRWLSQFDLRWLLPPGHHVLAVDAFNDSLKAGVLAGLRIDFQNGDFLEIGSDSSWKVVPESESGWEARSRPRANWAAATVVGAFGARPWDGAPVFTVSVPPLHPIEVHFWQTAWFQITSLTVCGLAILTALSLWIQLLLQSNSQRLLQRERARIARDIHDDLGAGLTQLVLLGELAQTKSSGDGERKAQMAQLCEKSRGLLGSMDDVVWAVNSKRDTLRDFAIHACKYAQAFLEQTSIRCRLDIEPDLPAEPFDLPVRRNLFLAVKEALNNAAKYSAASELFLRIHRIHRFLEVRVEDDGAGFDPERANPERNGLSNMKSRMAEVNGECVLTSKPGEGCRVLFRVRLPRRRASTWLRPDRSRDEAMQSNSSTLSKTP